MGIRTLILCIPATLVTLIFGLAPWGIIAIAVSLAIYAFVLFVPGKALVTANVNVALEGLTYGDLEGAKDHIDIALREAKMAKNIYAADIDILRSACEKVASALVNAGQDEAGTSLLKQSRSLTPRSSWLAQKRTPL